GKQRKYRRGGNRDRELLVEDTRNARHERGRYEHRDEHEADGNEGARYLVHRPVRRLARTETRAHMLFDGLDDDDRVVDNDPDRKDEREEREGIDRKAERELHREGADERDRDRDDRDDRGAPGLEEDEHDEDDEDKRLDQRFLNRTYRRLDIFGRVEGDLIFKARRKILRGSLDLLQDEIRGIERVGTGLLDDGHADPLLPVEHAAH